MKHNYEDRFRYTLPRRTYTMIRVDGKAFHTYTRGLARPFDKDLIEDMDATAAYLCKNIQGAKLAYVQSDEISVLVTDFDEISTDAWFDGNVQKMASVAASLATSHFNERRATRFLRYSEEQKNPANSMDAIDKRYDFQFSKFVSANFDARVFQIPSRIEVMNYFIWRQQDATRNSISSVAQSMYSHKELEGKSSDAKQEMIFQKGTNWNDFTPREKRGGVIEKVTYLNGEKYKSLLLPEVGDKDVLRRKWESVECPVFTQDTYFLGIRIPSVEQNVNAEDLENGVF